jgi:photosystem II stability/assembly factor-like uncharacterized protein
VLMGTDEGIFRSEDAGRTWQAVGGGLPRGLDAAGKQMDERESLASPSCIALERDATDPKRIYAGYLDAGPGEQAGIWRSIDDGLTWQVANAGLDPKLESFGPISLQRERILSLSAAPSMSRRLYAVGGFGIARTDDGGDQWRVMPSPCGEHASATAVHADPLQRDGVWIGASDGAIYRSSDAGSSWTKLSAGMPDPPTEFGDAVSVTMMVDGVERTFAGRRQAESATVHQIVRDARRGTVWAGTSRGLFRLDLKPQQ